MLQAQKVTILNGATSTVAEFPLQSMYSTEPPSSVADIASYSVQLHGVDVGVATGVSVGDGVTGTSVSVGVGVTSVVPVGVDVGVGVTGTSELVGVGVTSVVPVGVDVGVGVTGTSVSVGVGVGETTLQQSPLNTTPKGVAPEITLYEL
jgi:hypothetical protein